MDNSQFTIFGSQSKTFIESCYLVVQFGCQRHVVGGEKARIRGIGQSALRIKEAAQMGFARCVVPEANVEPGSGHADCEIVGVRTVGEALDALLS